MHRGLKIPVSAVRFRVWALKNRGSGTRWLSTKCARIHPVGHSRSTKHPHPTRILAKRVADGWLYRVYRSGIAVGTFTSLPEAEKAAVGT